MRTIKRYPNRKLYDMTDSRYITLNEIADLVRDGVEIRVIDSKTSEDITKITLAQVLLAEEKGNRPVAPIQRLLTLLHSGGEYIHKRLAPVAALREEAEKTIQKLIKVEPPEELKDFVSHTVKAYEDVQHRADEQLQFSYLLSKALLMHRKKLRSCTKVEELTQRIEALEKSQKNLRGAMRISARTEYAVLALMKLAQHVDLHPMRAKDIAESADIPKAFLDQLLLDLRRAGLIRSIRGPGGGSPWLTTLKTYCYMTSYWRSIALPLFCMWDQDSGWLTLYASSLLRFKRSLATSRRGC